MIKLNGYYNDRGMQKYSVFYISEHTSLIESAKTSRSKENKQKPQMSKEDINKVFERAQLHSLKVAIQIEAVDEEGRYYDDVVGSLAGYDELGIYISNEKVGYDEISHIEIYVPHKWSDLSDK